MISEECLTIEWIKIASAQNNNVDKILVEKAIRALRLLEGLVEENVEFVFKGGTSLMLLLESTKRLSIDIDIIVEKLKTQKISNAYIAQLNIIKELCKKPIILPIILLQLLIEVTIIKVVC